jgi:hypothetical protein
MSYEVGDAPANVVNNRRSMQKQLGFSTWQEIKQVHGDRMIFEPEAGAVEDHAEEEADGLATSVPGQALVVKTADCQPILLAHNTGLYVAALHVGWRGNAIGFPTSGAKAFCEHYGLDPNDVYAVRGPSLGPWSSVFENYAEEFGTDFDAYYEQARQTVNLWRLTRDQLLAAGLPEQNVFGLDLDTYGLTELFFSYRRNRNTGRQVSVVWIRE